MNQEVTHAQALRFVWKYARHYVLVIIAISIGMLASTGLTLAEPFFFRNAIDIIAANDVGDRGALMSALRMAIYGVLFGVGALTLHELSAVIMAWMENRVMRTVHEDAFSHVQRLSTKFHVNAFAGSTSRKIGRGIDGIEGMMDRIWFNFLPLIAFTVGLTVLLTIYAPLIGAAMITGIVIYTAISITSNLYLARYHRWTDRQDSRVTASMVDAITGNALVKAFAREEHEEKRHGDVVGEFHRRLWMSWRLNRTP